eukprot:TRINITY_DN367_c0_g1_i2.p3 TRINITY_DN367_c0_g1~~TRINITY_DN367_c0_g1_i2.p3  ORF type:complete len:105 (+),score=37.68 TRINITY_DN367_c0_g1_i2:98-412(+)
MPTPFPCYTPGMEPQLIGKAGWKGVSQSKPLLFGGKTFDDGMGGTVQIKSKWGKRDGKSVVTGCSNVQATDNSNGNNVMGANGAAHNAIFDEGLGGVGQMDAIF